MADFLKTMNAAAKAASDSEMERQKKIQQRNQAEPEKVVRMGDEDYKPRLLKGLNKAFKR